MRPRALFLSALILCLWLAGWLRFYRLDAQSYWNDEGISLGLAGRSVPTILRSAAADIHPPGYYLVLKAWHALTGDTEFALRGLSALAGIVLVALLYRLGRVYFDRPAALAAAALGALNPFLVYYSQEARMYALAATLAAASFLLFSLWLRSSRPPGSPYGDRRFAIGYCLVTAAGLYTHYAFAFVVLAENLAALGGLMAHGRAAAAGQDHRPGPSRLAVWFGLQAATLVLFLPWLPTAYHQLTNWPAATEHLPFLTALPDLWRYLVFGRTIDTAAAWAGLAGAAVLLVLGLRRRGQTITPLIWLLVPAALTLGFGLLTDAFSKFLVVAAPAACLLLGHGLAGLPTSLFTAVPGAADKPARRYGRRLLWIVEVLVWWGAVLGVGAGLYASLNNLYFNPAFARDDYRGIARYLDQVYRPGDAVITIAPNQVEAFGYYHRAGAEVFPLPHARPLDPAETAAALAGIAAAHPRIFVLYWGDEQADPQHVVENWLNTHAFKAGETWWGQVRLATYATATAASAPAVSSGGARFGDHVALVGYSLPATVLAPGDILQLSLFWQTDAPLMTRYKVFVHLYANTDQPPVAQQDGEPGGGLAPTTGWTVGKLVADNHGVLIPADLPPGKYQLMVGLYDLFSGTRLPITASGASAPALSGDRLALASITIQ